MVGLLRMVTLLSHVRHLEQALSCLPTSVSIFLRAQGGLWMMKNLPIRFGEQSLSVRVTFRGGTFGGGGAVGGERLYAFEAVLALPLPPRP
jgi:hypothetical protein